MQPDLQICCSLSGKFIWSIEFKKTLLLRIWTVILDFIVKFKGGLYIKEPNSPANICFKELHT